MIQGFLTAAIFVLTSQASAEVVNFTLDFGDQHCHIVNGVPDCPEEDGVWRTQKVSITIKDGGNGVAFGSWKSELTDGDFVIRAFVDVLRVGSGSYGFNSKVSVSLKGDNEPDSVSVMVQPESLASLNMVDLTGKEIKIGDKIWQPWLELDPTSKTHVARPRMLRF